MKLILLLAIDEEEGLVPANRAADGTAELVQIEFFWRGGEEALGIEGGIAEELEQGAVEIVGAGFSGDQYCGSGAGAVLGGVVVGQNFEFLNVVNRGKSPDTSGRQFVVVYSIQNPIGAIGTRAADG